MAFVTVKLKDLEDNPHRDPNAYRYSESKINSLMESISDTSFWENLFARKTRDGRIQLAYGHHRKQALLRLVEEGLTGYEEIKINVRPETELTNEMMLKIFAQENKDEWGEDPQNLCMTVLQLKAHLENLLLASSNKDEFLKKVGAAGALKMDDRSFTRAKNNGVGASQIAQFLGQTWSRQTIQDAMSLIESDEETFKLAQNLPNVTLANRFQRLVTKEKGTKKKDAEMFDEKEQKKVADRIIKHQLTRKDVEDALKIKDGMETPDPVAAIDVVVKAKKDKIKAAREAAAAERPAPKDPIDKVLSAMERVLETVRRERINLRDDDIVRVKTGWGLIEEVLDTEPEEIAKMTTD